MRQAIRTTYLAPTNHRGARIKAHAAAGSKVYSWDYALDHTANHERAALAYAASLGWVSGQDLAHRLQGGCLPDGSYCWVIVSHKARGQS